MAKNKTFLTYDSTIPVMELFKKKENRRKLAVFSLCEVESVAGLVKYKITGSLSTYHVISSTNNVYTTSLLDTAGSTVYI